MFASEVIVFSHTQRLKEVMQVYVSLALEDTMEVGKAVKHS